MRTLAFFLLITLSLVFPARALAIVDPLQVTNNKFGIHIINEYDIAGAQELINSSGGDWGYVTLVIRTDERDTNRWQRVFDDLRRKHLIPIIRVASIQEDDGWEKLAQEDIGDWLEFFDSLNWVVQNRYVVVGNEVNHASEWGGDIEPSEYTFYLRSFYEKAKSFNENYFILPAGLDASAPNSRDHMSEDNYLSQMLQADPDIFNYIDGWNSHSYPNPDFSGNWRDKGRGTITTYEWELDYLRRLGVNRNLPVFITETGWKHDISGQVLGYKTEDEVSDNIVNAYSDVWNDERVVAVTPFLLGYNDAPFEQFSWKRSDGDYYDFYNSVKAVGKMPGEPVQVSTGEIEFIILPEITQAGRIGTVLARIENTGQSIWKSGEDVEVTIGDEDVTIEPMRYLGDVEPGRVGLVFFRHNSDIPCDLVECEDVITISPTNNLAQFRGIVAVILASEYEARELN